MVTTLYMTVDSSVSLEEDCPKVKGPAECVGTATRVGSLHIETLESMLATLPLEVE